MISLDEFLSENFVEKSMTENIDNNNLIYIIYKINNLTECNIDNIIKTTPLLSTQNDNENLLIEIIDLKRIFYQLNNNKKEVGYIELIPNYNSISYNILNNNITFLFNPDKTDNKFPNFSECIGFRYYIDNPLTSKIYFTLLLKNKKKNEFFILEKDTNIQQNPFYNKELNCLDIIKSIIFKKYENIDYSNDYPFSIGEPILEILGFSYSINLINHNVFNFLPLYIADSYKYKTLFDFDKVEKNKGYFIPICYKKHVSLLYFQKNKNDTIKFLNFNMSHNHCYETIDDKLKLDEMILPKDITEKMLILPSNEIQLYNSCGIWLYGQILNILESTEENQLKYLNTDIFINSLKNKSYYIDTCNIIFKYTNISDCLIQLINSNSFENINLDKNYIYILNKSTYIKLNKKSILNNFVNIYSLIKFFIENKSLKLSQLYLLKQINEFQNNMEIINNEVMEINLNLNKRKLKLLMNTKKNNNKKVLEKYLEIENFESYNEQLKYLMKEYIKNSLGYIYYNQLLEEFEEKKSYIFFDQNKITEEIVNNEEKKNAEFLTYSLFYNNIKKNLENIISEFKEKKDTFKKSHKIYEINDMDNVIPLLGLLLK